MYILFKEERKTKFCVCMNVREINWQTTLITLASIVLRKSSFICRRLGLGEKAGSIAVVLHRGILRIFRYRGRPREP
jgi:hypothetical protein